jgi:hypothetical protein
MLTTDSFDVASASRPKSSAATAADLLALFDDATKSLRDALASVRDDELQQEWCLTAGERTIVAGPRALMLRRMGLTHIAHHRAQLGVYYRMLDVPVPGLFGPSADER